MDEQLAASRTFPRTGDDVRPRRDGIETLTGRFTRERTPVGDEAEPERGNS